VNVSVPDHFQQALGALARYRPQFEQIWESARATRELASTEQQLHAPLTAVTREVLLALYPDSSAALSKPVG
jgi:hypothetical protein